MITRVSDKAPEFPCWIWVGPTKDVNSFGWLYYPCEYNTALSFRWTHWYPDQLTVPNVVPKDEIPQEFLDALKDVEEGDFVDFHEDPALTCAQEIRELINKDVHVTELFNEMLDNTIRDIIRKYFPKK